MYVVVVEWLVDLLKAVALDVDTRFGRETVPLYVFLTVALDVFQYVVTNAILYYSLFNSFLKIILLNLLKTYFVGRANFFSIMC